MPPTASILKPAAVSADTSCGALANRDARSAGRGYERRGGKLSAVSKIIVNPGSENLGRIVYREARQTMAVETDRESLRRKASAWLALAGSPGFVFCGFAHVCMAGHGQHGPYPTWQAASDLFWISSFVIAAVFSLKSRMWSRRKLCVSLLLLLVLRLTLGGDSLLELPLLLLVGVVAIRGLMGPERTPQAAGSSLSDQSPSADVATGLVEHGMPAPDRGSHEGSSLVDPVFGKMDFDAIDGQGSWVAMPGESREYMVSVDASAAGPSQEQREFFTALLARLGEHRKRAGEFIVAEHARQMKEVPEIAPIDTSQLRLYAVEIGGEADLRAGRFVLEFTDEDEIDVHRVGFEGSEPKRYGE